MTSGIEQTVIIIVVFALFYFLKVSLTIAGGIIQARRELAGLSKTLNISALIVLLVSWIPFILIVFNFDESSSEESVNLGFILNSLLFTTYTIVASLLSVSLKKVHQSIAKSALRWWLMSLLFIILNIILVALQFIVSDTENKVGFISGIWLIETLFFILFFITIYLLPKK